MVVKKSEAGYVVVVNRWGVVRSSALLSYRRAAEIRRRLARRGECARMMRRSA